MPLWHPPPNSGLAGVLKRGQQVLHVPVPLTETHGGPQTHCPWRVEGRKQEQQDHLSVALQPASYRGQADWKWSKVTLYLLGSGDPPGPHARMEVRLFRNQGHSLALMLLPRRVGYKWCGQVGEYKARGGRTGISCLAGRRESFPLVGSWDGSLGLPLDPHPNLAFPVLFSYPLVAQPLPGCSPGSLKDHNQYSGSVWGW